MPTYHVDVHRPRAGLVAAVVLLAGLLPGCGGDTTAEPGDASAPASSAATPGDDATARPTDAPEPESDPGVRIEVRIAGGQVEPRGERVPVVVGEPVTVEVDADTPGRLHVHGTPEVELEFPAGRSRHRFTLSQPGIVEMELHDPALTVVQLEAR